jgi:sugar phosphate isomerase/epimerase
MDIKILSTQWGYEHLDVEVFLRNVKEAGYDGIDTWAPESQTERKILLQLLEELNLSMVSHQYQANGRNINEFCKSYEYYLNLSLELNPILINSHSGKDYFTLDEQLKVLDTAENFALQKNIRVVHETHRGCIGFSPMNFKKLFQLRPQMKITADFSHWVCVTESYLENFEKEILEAVKRADHIHARVGFTEGPQIPDPRNSFWEQNIEFFFILWEQILVHHQTIGSEVFTITPEFGPPPYMWTNLEDNSPVVSQWEINLHMKKLLETKFSQFFKS